MYVCMYVCMHACMHACMYIIVSLSLARARVLSLYTDCLNQKCMYRTCHSKYCVGSTLYTV